ncbi:DUF1972 domain-containing protein [Aeromonas eucrenophila]|uniref:DUF1972 domain-containing protein n=1 Tax=Aeromonas eucrenophila TaxID=649 RepID=A0ABW0YC25_9GAMM|nr:DUF1972 domain-containing protein [Aeromonas eucrenophila]
MKISINVIGTVGIPACYGGFETLVQNMIDSQSEHIEYNVFCSSQSYIKKTAYYKRAKLIYLPIKANGISSIPYDILSLLISLWTRPNVTLILGVSGGLFLPIYRLFSTSRIVTNIDGLEWRRDKWGHFAKAFLKLSERFAVKFSDVVVSDNQAIADYVHTEYGVQSKVIAYGGDHALLTDKLIPSAKDDYFLALCRIEPENNVAMILGAFANSQYKLKFVGNWDTSTYGRELKNRFSNYENIDIIDPVYDISDLFNLRSQCKGYVHGHSAGGTNPSLVEAMQFGMPIYAFDCTFSRHTTDNRSFYFCDGESLRQLIGKHNDRAVIQSGLEMKSIAEESYKWATIVEKYEEIY